MDIRLTAEGLEVRDAKGETVLDLRGDKFPRGGNVQATVQAELDKTIDPFWGQRVVYDAKTNALLVMTNPYNEKGRLRPPDDPKWAETIDLEPMLPTLEAIEKFARGSAGGT